MDGLEALATPVATEISTPEPAAPETPEPSTPETPAEPETPVGGEETPPETGGEEELPGAPEPDDSVETDGRALDENTRKIVAELKKTNPGAAKALADQFYRRLAYQKEFPTVQDARRAKATIESLGGEEGITKLQDEVTDYRTEIEQFANGDPALITQLYEGNPKATVKMMQAGLDLLVQKNDVQGIKELLYPHMAQELVSGPLGQSLVEAAKFIEEGKGPEAYAKLEAIGKWLGKIRDDADNLKKNRTAPEDPREKQFKEREERLQTEERKRETQVLSEDITRLNNEHLRKTLDPFFKDAGIRTPEGKREFTQNLMNKVWAAMKADTVYVRQANNIRDKGDRQRTAQFISAKFAELLPGVFRTYRNSLYPSLAKAAAKPVTPTNGKPAAPKSAIPTNSGNAIQVAEAPKYDDVDWKKTNDITWAKGFAYLTNGKYVYFH